MVNLATGTGIDPIRNLSHAHLWTVQGTDLDHIWTIQVRRANRWVIVPPGEQARSQTEERGPNP